MRLFLLVTALLSSFVAGGCIRTENPHKPDGDDAKAIRLVLNVDDAGVFQGTADGVVRLWKAHAISSVSIMAFGQDFDHAVGLFTENKIPTGVHLALNHGSGVLPANRVPSLHAPDGNLWNTVDETMSHMKLEEAQLELEAQIRKLIDAGIKPTHLDSHMGILFMKPELLNLYSDLAVEFKTALALPAGSYFDSVRNRLSSESLVTSVSLDGIYALQGVDENLLNRTSAYESLLKNLRPGLNHFYSHPVPPSEATKAAYNDFPIRNDDYALFMSDEWKRMLAENNIVLSYYY